MLKEPVTFEIVSKYCVQLAVAEQPLATRIADRQNVLVFPQEDMRYEYW